MALRIGYSMLSRRLGAAVAAASADAITIQLGAATKCSTSLLSLLRIQQQQKQLQQFPAYSQASSRFSTLSSILNDEYNYETANYTKDAVVAAGPPAPFTLSEAPGDTEVTLKRKFNNEEVVVSATVNDQPDIEDEAASDAEEEGSSLVSFYVSVNKGNDSLVFECTSDGTYLQIEHVAFEPKEGFESKTMYTGPVFYELDTNLRTQFQEYLAERGVDEQLGDYLRHVIYDKEQQEYTSWLSRVDSFLKK
jgi:hypothetical protein